MYLKKNVRSRTFKGREFVTSDESMMSSKWMSKFYRPHGYKLSKNGHQENVIVFTR